MKQNRLSIRFVINKAKMNKRGLCPISCRLTYRLKRKAISTGEFINPLQWNAKTQQASSKTISGQQINLQLQIITANIKKAHLQLQMMESEFGVNEIYSKYIGKVDKKEDYVISYFEKFLAKQFKLIGKDLKLSTWKKFEYVYNDVKEFIKSKYDKTDYSLSKLDQSFLDDFEYYLKTVKNQKQVTINKGIQRFRKPIRVALVEGYLVKDPFVQHKPGRVRKEVIFLSADELKLLEDYNFNQPRLQLVKDLFIFCCYTGLAYNEMSNLKKEHVIKGFDGNDWIRMKREKTDKLISVPLLAKASIILNKYQNDNEYMLPKFSNQKINSYLKEIAGIVGINKAVSHHMARKTFASTVLLYNDVPMEIVSELLGHSSITITQEYYGKVVQKKVGLEMDKLKNKLKLE
ncbi:site-specific integrase [uncultured Maribacter sp.]|uniref:site-specific integrase n=1 Tax=uncultured Maribacter sp. TaxID=431308 RepID=UPI0026059772|nr:site-specific integrase [uncultured Maribacter sp.]